MLIACNASWKPVLDTYNRSAPGANRKAAALFALMRFASTEPNVREGNYRVEGFAKYSYFRDNWWCRTIPHNDTDPKPKDADYEFWGEWTNLAHASVSDPLFLTAQDRQELAEESSRLSAIPKASRYFPQEAIAWQSAHPHDPRAPELLGQAFRVVRNACSDDSSTATEHQLFLLLHRQYPHSPWTLRYKSWD